MRVFARNIARVAAAGAAAALTSSSHCTGGGPAAGRRISASEVVAGPMPPRSNAAASGGTSSTLPAIDLPDDMGVCACGEASRRAFDNSAPEYDSLVGQEELFMGLRLLRWWLLGKSEGRVLEVACGTARNIDYFRAAPDGATEPSQGVTSLTLVDASQGMLDEARRKARERSTSRGALAEVRVVKASAEALPLDDGEFDTVADTFGLCSMDDPVGALLEMQRVCKPGGKVSREQASSGTQRDAEARQPAEALLRKFPAPASPDLRPARRFCFLSTASERGSLSMACWSDRPRSTLQSGAVGTTVTWMPSSRRPDSEWCRGQDGTLEPPTSTSASLPARQSWMPSGPAAAAEPQLQARAPLVFESRP